MSEEILICGVKIMHLGFKKMSAIGVCESSEERKVISLSIYGARVPETRFAYIIFEVLWLYENIQEKWKE